MMPAPTAMTVVWSTMSAANSTRKPTDMTKGAKDRLGMCTTARGRPSVAETTSAPRHPVGQ